MIDTRIKMLLVWPFVLPLVVLLFALQRGYEALIYAYDDFRGVVLDAQFNWKFAPWRK